MDHGICGTRPPRGNRLSLFDGIGRLCARNQSSLVVHNPFEECIHMHAENLRQFEQPARANTIDARFVFLDLLISNSKAVPHFMQGKIGPLSQQSYAFADRCVENARSPA